jgi:hypothetical protein
MRGKEVGPVGFANNYHTMLINMVILRLSSDHCANFPIWNALWQKFDFCARFCNLLKNRRLRRHV